MSEIPAKARKHVLERSGGLCERCGQPGTDTHHRRRRREGDNPHRVVNLLRLCRPCHDHAHAHPLEALETGVVVASTVTDPAAVPVEILLWGRMPVRVYLEEEGYGNFTPLDTPDPLAPTQELA